MTDDRLEERNVFLQAGLLNLAKAYDDAGGIAISSIIHAVSDDKMHLNAHRSFADRRSLGHGCLRNSLRLLRSLDVLLRNLRADEMRTNLAENFFRLYHFVHVRRERLSSSFAQRRSFRYGLSITFFIIIGDQLDRCT